MTQEKMRNPNTGRDYTKQQLFNEIRKNILFTLADFEHCYTPEEDPLPTKESEVTAFIKKRTDLYIQSWVIPYLDDLEERICPKEVKNV